MTFPLFIRYSALFCCLFNCFIACQQYFRTEVVTMATGHASGALVGGIADPRHIPETNAIGKAMHNASDINQATVPQTRASIYNNAKITFEEYHYWANRTRELENSIPTSGGGLSGIFKWKAKRKQSAEAQANPIEAGNEKRVERQQENTLGDSASAIADSEWSNARGATRTATWGE